MDDQNDKIIIDEDFEDTEKNDLDSYRIPTRRTEKDNENEPLLHKKRTNSSSKTCFRSMGSADGNNGSRSVFNYLPVIFALFVFSVIYGSFFVYNLKPAINQDLAHYGVLSDRIICHTLFIHLFLFLQLVSYVLCMYKNPGNIPDTLEWNLNNKDVNTTSVVYETKRSGARRFCKWCSKFKPDRTHHCKNCGTCVLKMDHHCPWANNCIGWRNYKYFYLTTLYSDVISIYIAILLFPTVRQFLNNPLTSFGDLVVIIVAEVLGVVLGLVLTCFLLFHTWLICENFTTIEFCEKYSGSKHNMDESIWSLGLYNNLKSVLGNNPLLWLIPYDNRKEKGIEFKRGERSLESLDDIDQPIMEVNSEFLRMTKDTKQFDPEIGEDSP
ncbi:uncharacterized protein TA13215 [Theileria annulata]|uniref:Palmitoyltransferase n=1 Tax=Theileria annulata TaxID=5874 RepID=Q4UEE8_THEAN|nr:uncharacterized protein TA13215 [Theileria annulata]CAI74541.1 hypothetical protein, conserved [Theileria annulata]|eukprot:XP_952273.1 hypothetical protein, conserved [Theileria annulata]